MMKDDKETPLTQDRRDLRERRGNLKWNIRNIGGCGCGDIGVRRLLWQWRWCDCGNSSGGMYSGKE